MVNRKLPRHKRITAAERAWWKDQHHKRLAAIARELDVSRAAVSRVFRGVGTSGRISRAIDAAMFGARRVA